jgi:hypothetical protein
MFGSNFFENFGLPQFPFANIDQQGGMMAPNQPMADPSQAGQQTPPQQSPPAAGLPAAPQMPGIGSPGPLGGSVLSPGAGATPQMPGAAPGGPPQGTAPAAGIGSPFGRPTL